MTVQVYGEFTISDDFLNHSSDYAESLLKKLVYSRKWSEGLNENTYNSGNTILSIHYRENMKIVKLLVVKNKYDISCYEFTVRSIVEFDEFLKKFDSTIIRTDVERLR